MLLIINIYMVGLWKAWKEKKKGHSYNYVVLAILKQFPEGDGNYTGFKDPSITELDFPFFE